MSGSRDYDNLIRSVLIGPEHSGKSSLMLRVADNEFTSSYIATTGTDFRTYTYTNSETTEKNKVQLWDTSGQERFEDYTRNQYRGADVGIFVLDANHLLIEDIAYLEKVYKYFKQDNSNASTLLFITKEDVITDKKGKNCLKERAAVLARELGVQDHIICSAKNMNAAGINHIKSIIDKHGIAALKQNGSYKAPVNSASASSSVANVKVKVKAKPKPKELSIQAQNDFEEAIKNLQTAFEIKSEPESEALWLDGNKGTHEYNLYTSIKSLKEKAKNDLDAKGQEEVALATKTMAKQLFDCYSSYYDCRLTKNEANDFTSVMKKYQAKPGWREIIGAILGAIAGFVAGASLVGVMGPAAIAPAVLLSVKGAAMGAALVGGATLTGFGTFFGRRHSDPAYQAAQAAKSFGPQPEPFKLPSLNPFKKKFILSMP